MVSGPRAQFEWFVWKVEGEAGQRPQREENLVEHKGNRSICPFIQDLDQELESQDLGLRGQNLGL